MDITSLTSLTIPDRNTSRLLKLALPVGRYEGDGILISSNIATLKKGTSFILEYQTDNVVDVKIEQDIDLDILPTDKIFIYARLSTSGNLSIQYDRTELTIPDDAFLIGTENSGSIDQIKKVVLGKEVPVFGKVKLNTPQAIPLSSIEILNFDTIVINIGSIASTGLIPFTINKEGTYVIILRMGWGQSGPSTVDERDHFAFILINGIALTNREGSVGAGIAGTGSPLVQSTVEIIDLQVGDTVQVGVFQESVASLLTGSSVAETQPVLTIYEL